jgi:nitrate/nitrite-specific signal transduction histidine kinase
MSIYARLRVLLALSVLVIGGSVWLVAGQQRDAVIGMQGQLRASSDLLTAMLDRRPACAATRSPARRASSSPM